jgi:hypothetical protein
MEPRGSVIRTQLCVHRHFIGSSHNRNMTGIQLREIFIRKETDMKDDDIISNQSNNPSFEAIIEARLSRRGFLGGGLATAATVALGGVSALLKAVPASAQKRGRLHRRRGRGAARIYG